MPQDLRMTTSVRHHRAESPTTKKPGAPRASASEQETALPRVNPGDRVSARGRDLWAHDIPEVPHLEAPQPKVMLPSIEGGVSAGSLMVDLPRTAQKVRVSAPARQHGRGTPPDVSPAQSPYSRRGTPQDMSPAISRGSRSKGPSPAPSPSGKSRQNGAWTSVADNAMLPRTPARQPDSATKRGAQQRSSPENTYEAPPRRRNGTVPVHSRQNSVSEAADDSSGMSAVDVAPPAAAPPPPPPRNVQPSPSYYGDVLTASLAVPSSMHSDTEDEQLERYVASPRTSDLMSTDPSHGYSADVMGAAYVPPAPGTAVARGHLSAVLEASTPGASTTPSLHGTPSYTGGSVTPPAYDTGRAGSRNRNGYDDEHAAPWSREERPRVAPRSRADRPDAPQSSGPRAREPPSPLARGRSAVEPPSPAARGHSALDPPSPPARGRSMREPPSPLARGRSAIEPPSPAARGHSAVEPPSPPARGRSALEPPVSRGRSEREAPAPRSTNGRDGSVAGSHRSKRDGSVAGPRSSKREASVSSRGTRRGRDTPGDSRREPSDRRVRPLPPCARPGALPPCSRAMCAVVVCSESVHNERI